MNGQSERPRKRFVFMDQSDEKIDSIFTSLNLGSFRLIALYEAEYGMVTLILVQV